MKKNTLILSLLIVLLSFLGGFFYARIRNGQNTPYSDFYCCHNITEKDVVLLSSSNHFSGRLVYPKELPENEDVIPDEIIAAKLGLLLLESVYGERVYEDKPYQVTLLDSIWVVETSLLPPPPEIDNSKINPDMELQTIICGGVGHVEINKHNGKIYTIYHTK